MAPAAAPPPPRSLTANEAACVTGVPLRKVHCITDTGVLGNGRSRRDRASWPNPVSVPAFAPASHSSSFDQLRRSGSASMTSNFRGLFFFLPSAAHGS